jgi:hypothetical protein
MVGDILDGHMAAKCENIAFKGSGIGSALIGESKLDLAHDLATQTLNPLYGQLNVHRDGTNRYRPKSAQYGASPLHGATVAFRAPEPVLASGNPENNGTFLKKSANILIAVNTESVIQQACGHPICLSVLCGNLLKDMDVHFFQPKVRSFRMNLNLNGTYYCTRAVLPCMRDQKSGLVINVASWAGVYTSALVGPAYNSSKHAVVSLTQTINMEECTNNIRACVICPGEVDTPIMEQRPVPPPAEERARMLRAGDVGNAICWVAEQPAHVCINEIIISPAWNRLYVVPSTDIQSG